MIRLQTFSDKTAIGLSLLCTIHCLMLPVLLILFPSALLRTLDNEAFHFWMIFAAIPVSVYALALGYGQHKRKYVLMLGLVGLAFLLFAVFIPESPLAEWSEKAFTLIGAVFIVIAHFNNYKLYQDNTYSHSYDQ